MSESWTVAAAKAKFSEVIERAASDGPQLVTRNGKPAAIIVSAEEWQRRTAHKGSLVEFFMSSPLHESLHESLRGSAMPSLRLKGRLRKVRL